MNHILFTSLDEISQKLKINFDKNENAHANEIVNIFNGNVNNVDLTNAILLNILGLYHENVGKDNEQTKKYYEMAANVGNVTAMCNLGLYYANVEKNSVLMKKYYEMSANMGNSAAMNNLGMHYCQTEHDYVKALHYYKSAIALGNIEALNSLGVYYFNIEHNYVQMKKYCMMAANAGNAAGMFTLGYYYQHIDPNYDLMTHYYKMSIMSCSLGNQFVMDNLEKTLSKIELFKILYDIDNPTEQIKNKLTELLTDSKIATYANTIEPIKISNTFEECII